ncbi:GNAT family N-acetyltransferase [Microlunatus ginsengisoli]|uniref:GNAT family N-acetyltransferase n=1 Tax=Microlunatus ginsengisoli TaxID=363863 RepID=A0ABP6ZD26_9ACTN
MGVGEVRWAPLQADDAVRVRALLTASEQFDRAGPRILHGWRHQLAPIGDEQTDTLAARTADGRLVALGWVSARPYDDPPRRVFLAGTVHPDYRGRGLGRRVLDWQLDAARRWQREIGGDPITVVASTAPLPDVHALLSCTGFERERVFAELSLPLPRDEGPGPNPAIAGATLVAFSADRAEEVRVVLNTAFAEHWGTRVLQTEPWQAVLGSETFRPAWSRLALDGEDRVVGFVLNSAAPHPTYGRVGWTDQLGVLPRWRGRGLGAALMRDSLDVFEAKGLALAGLGLDTQNPFGAPALYASLGYRPGFDVHLFTRTEPALAPPGSR